MRTIDLHPQMWNIRLQPVTTSFVGHKVHRPLAIMIKTARLIYLAYFGNMNDIFKGVGQVLEITDREICTIPHSKLCEISQKEVISNIKDVEQLLQIIIMQDYNTTMTFCNF